jgi:hypothetical protein
VTAAVVKLTPRLAVALPSTELSPAFAPTAPEMLDNDAFVSTPPEVQRHVLSKRDYELGVTGSK